MESIVNNHGCEVDFYMSLSDSQIIGKDCSNPGEHAWLIVFIDFGGN